MENQAILPSGEYERVDITQARGPRLKFEGKMIARTDFQSRGHDPMRIAYEIWETRGGALIAVSNASPADREGFENTEALVVKPEVEQTMQFIVMDFFQWHDRARAMVRKQLKWKLTQQIA